MYQSGELQKLSAQALCESHERLRMEMSGMQHVFGEALHEIDQTLRVDAAEYVPAIGDVFKIIDRECRRLRLLDVESEGEA